MLCDRWLVLSLLVLGSQLLMSREAGAASFTFTPLGGLAGSYLENGATEVSADGTVVVGRSGASLAVFRDAFRWTKNEGMVDLGALSGSSISEAYSVSADGTFIVGYSASQAFRWTASEGMVGLGDLPGGSFLSVGRGVSGDGGVVVGESISTSGREAFRWTPSSGMVGLGDLEGGGFFSIAFDVSADGATVVGVGVTSTGRQAFRWTAGEGMVGLGDLPGGITQSTALSASSDGAIVVGWGNSELGREAFRWTAGDGMVGLGDLPGGGFESLASDISADGTVIVGQGSSNSGQEAFIWTDRGGLTVLQDVLITGGVTNLEGWKLTHASGVSADGRTIVGYGIDPDGYEKAWVATVPEPGTWALAMCGTAMIGLYAFCCRFCRRGQFRANAGLAIVCVVLASSLSRAADVRWFGNQSGQVAVGDVGSFHDGINWEGFAPPTNQDWAQLGTGLAPVLPGTPPRHIFFGDVTLNYAGDPNDQFVPGGTADVVLVDVQNGDWTFDFGAWNTPGGASGRLIASALQVGNRMSDFGDVPGAASLTLRGPGAASFNSVTVGQFDAAGQLVVESDAALETTWLDVGSLIYVGATGETFQTPGMVRIEGSGVVQARVTRVERNSGLVISNGGKLLKSNPFLTESAWIQSTGPGQGATVTGMGSLWDMDGQLRIGDFDDDGELRILNGGRVSSTMENSATGSSGIAGTYLDRGIGYVTVDGVGSQWTQDGAMVVGQRGEGHLTIGSGGLIASARGFIGRFEESQGPNLALIHGDGSQWQVEQTMGVGSDGLTSTGAGTLQLTNEGLATVGERLLIGAAGVVDVDSEGKVTIGNATPVSGAIVVGTGGTLGGTGTIIGDVLVDSGDVAPGFSPGTLHIDGNFEQGSLGRLFMEIGGALPGQYDQLDVTGDLFLGGTVSLTLIDGFTPRFGDQFELFRVGGDFDFSGTTFNSANLMYDAAFVNGVYSITMVPEPSTLALVSVGALVGACCIARRKWQQAPRVAYR